MDKGSGIDWTEWTFRDETEFHQEADRADNLVKAIQEEAAELVISEILDEFKDKNGRNLDISDMGIQPEICLTLFEKVDLCMHLTHLNIMAKDEAAKQRIIVALERLIEKARDCVPLEGIN